MGSLLRTRRIERPVALGLVAGVVYLTLRRGGVNPLDQQIVFGSALVLLALVAVAGGSARTRTLVPWPLAVVALLPVLQLLPLSSLGQYPQPRFRTELTERFVAAGVEPFGSVSIYPYATAQSALALAGCCALFALARRLGLPSTKSLAARGKSAVHTKNRVRSPILASAVAENTALRTGKNRLTVPIFWRLTLHHGPSGFAIAALLLLALTESIVGTQQYLQAQIAGSQGFSGSHGTFVNKNHFCAFLEGCFGLAFGAALGGFAKQSRRTNPQWRGPIVAATVAGFCLAAGVFSFSRAGIVVLFVMTLAAATVAVRTNRRSAIVFTTVAVIAIAFAALAGVSGLDDRFLEIADEGGETGRLLIWSDTIDSARHYLWTGSGLGTFPFAFRREAIYLPRKTIDHAHSDFLEWLLELGLPATVFVVACIVGLFIKTASGVRHIKDPGLRMTAFGATLGAVGIFLHAAVDFPLQIPAVAALAAVLLGCASGAAAAESPRAGVPRWAVVCGALGFAALAVWPASGGAENWNAERLYVRGQEFFASGQLVESDRLWAATLAANPYAAAVWLRRAELAEIQGNYARAVEFAEIAKRLEPFTLRTEWPVAQIHLRRGEQAEALGGLGAIVTAVPKMRRVVLRSAWDGGVSSQQIVASLLTCDEEDIADYLLFLGERSQWEQILTAARNFREKCEATIPTPVLQYLVDRLFEANQGLVLEQLAAELEPGDHQGRPQRAEGSEARRNRRPSSATAPDFGWVARPLSGVVVQRRWSASDGQFLQIEFRRPQNLYYRHLTYDFPVDPNRLYTLHAEIACEELTGSEGAQLVVSTPLRYIASSEEVNRTTSWRKARIRFRTLASESVIRAVIVRNRSRRLDNLMSGTVFVRNLALREEIRSRVGRAEGPS